MNTAVVPQHHFASLDVDKMLDGPNSSLMSPPDCNALHSPNIMGRTAKFAVSNQQLNNKTRLDRATSSSSTKMAGNVMSHEKEPFAELLSPPSETVATEHADPAVSATNRTR